MHQWWRNVNIIPQMYFLCLNCPHLCVIISAINCHVLSVSASDDCYLCAATASNLGKMLKIIILGILASVVLSGEQFPKKSSDELKDSNQSLDWLPKFFCRICNFRQWEENGFYCCQSSRFGEERCRSGEDEEGKECKREEDKETASKKE